MMKLDFIDLGKLSVSKANMRYAKKAPDVSDILPTVRKRSVIVPLLVRPQSCPEPVEGCGPEAYEIVAGARRFHAARLVAEEKGEAEPLPCAILEDGDDADAIEASLIENLARLDADEVTQWETFVRLVKEGRSVEDISATFGMPELMVRRILALGNLLPRIRDLYAREKIDAATVRHLTMASKSQQRAWLALYDDPDNYTPTGHQLKAWLLCRARHNSHYVDRVIMPSKRGRGASFLPASGILVSIISSSSHNLRRRMYAHCVFVRFRAAQWGRAAVT